jgi:flagellar biosynthesis protein FlhF
VRDLPESLFLVFTDLIEADLSEEVARELIERVRAEVSGAELADPVLAKARVARMIETEIPIAGPILVTPGRRRLAALVGPTGVGKTTTIAKLAAYYRLKEKRDVGLITVDTYRIAAVEQLRTYADIIDLPMQVVSTPREMREAVRRLDGLDLVLMDTAGRSPRDEIKIQELKSFLNEARADEVHLVLSSVASARTLEQTARRFAAVGTTALILTKLDEATGLGNVVPLLRNSGLPLSYLTNGQNVPDDIETADAARLARVILGTESACCK